MTDVGEPLARDGSGLLSALRTQRLCGRVFAVVLHVVGFLAGGNAHDADGVADHVGGALLALGPVGIDRSEFWECWRSDRMLKIGS
ncbi:hypothetical protein [Mesorhizobium sp. M1204]|uniref:hypothetical protein n=1 Tax=Mesorhizobium sp. M1204 TaxID=2957068 RepID=UPI003338645B